MPAMSEKNPDLANLLERSPLGTQEARLLRRRADDVASVVAAAEGRDRAVSCQPLVRTDHRGQRIDHMGHRPSQPEEVPGSAGSVTRGRHVTMWINKRRAVPAVTEAGTAPAGVQPDRSRGKRGLGPAISTMSGVGDDLDLLVSAAVDGDRDAIAGVLGHVHRLVTRYCRARIGSHGNTFASADHLAQEVCLAVLAVLPSYRDQNRSFLAFVYGIAAHKVADAHRSVVRNRAEPVPELADFPVLAGGPEQQATQGELADRMTKLLSTLPDEQREILVLRVVVGLSAEETAEAMGSTPAAVRVAQHRALDRLRNALAS
jgi:RNA polymerase sigma-70 factor, ECF subfamily